MDLGYLKIKIDIKSEYDEYKKKYDFKRKEIKKEEIKKVFEGFKEFFKLDGNFKFKETDHTMIAEYRDHAITLDVDIYKNTDAPGFDIEGLIKTYEKQVYEFVVTGITDHESSLAPYVDDQERMIQETRKFKEFLDGETIFTYRYIVKGSEKSYGTMQEMMLGL
ncbi:MAG: hypothetical protein EOO45_19500 [Flavobacterium sp.]|nr:MAG: hypothetical protein EOO45_19500 [Flavobacterium sp.]